MDENRLNVLFTFYFIGRKVKGHYKKENKDIIFETAILNILRHGEVTISDLAKKMYSKVSSISEKISLMEEKGLISRHEKEEDKRESYVSLTSRGKAKVEEVIKMMGKHCVEMTRNISDNEITRLLPLLQKFLD